MAAAAAVDAEPLAAAAAAAVEASLTKRMQHGQSNQANKQPETPVSVTAYKLHLNATAAFSTTASTLQPNAAERLRFGLPINAGTLNAPFETSLLSASKKHRPQRLAE